MPSATRVNLPLLTLGTPTAPGAYDPSTNKITAFSYDGRGNVAVVPSNIRTATYDGENRQKAATNLNGYSAEYFYDGDGRRVRKVYTQGQTVTTTTFVYDAMGQLAAEYGGTPEPGGRQYVTVDHLGSTRLVTNAQGAAVKTHDYLPFGEELNVACLDAPGGVKFTGHLRDQESCLDFAEARYLSSMQGRFTSPDAPFNDQHEGNPQRWNLYSYARNNPLKYVDPTGQSTHTDWGGSVVAAYDDRDLGIYRHSDLSWWDRISVLPKEGPGIQLMGLTRIWDEFRAHDKAGHIQAGIAANAHILFGDSFDEDVEGLNALSREGDLFFTALESRNGGLYDIKANKAIAPFGPNTGKLLNGVYVTARTAGNFLAGLNGATGAFYGGSISQDIFMRLAGALEQSRMSGAAWSLITGQAYGPAPYYGESKYSGDAAILGFQTGVQLRTQMRKKNQAIQ